MIVSRTAAALFAAALSTGPVVAQQAAPMSEPSGSFVTKQGADEFRASKFVGLDVYGSEGTKVGDIAEILIAPQGGSKTVVIDVGGFMGIGAKRVALPWTAVSWVNDPPPTRSAGDRPATTSSTAPRSGMGNGPVGGNTPAPGAVTRSPAEQAAYNGYPNHATIAMTMTQLKEAPDFKYVADGTSSDSK